MIDNQSRILFDEYKDKNGVSITAHSEAAPLLLVMLRRIGCPFCRQTLQDLCNILPLIRDRGYEVGIVHMEETWQTRQELARYRLDHLPPIFRDADRSLYQALGVNRAPLRSLFTPRFMRDGVRSSLEHGVTFPEVDPFQLPGAFLIDQGRVVADRKVLTPNESPDILSLVVHTDPPPACELVLS